jgi:hypothetical protein
MFRSKKQIENELPILAKKNLITTKVSKSKDEYGQITTKRVIKINWEKLNEIKVEMDDFLNQDFDDGTIQLFNKEDLIQSQDNEEEMEDKTDGVVYIFRKGKEFLMKNKNDIYVRYLGIGSQLSLYYKFENEKTENYTRTLNSRFSSYLESTGKEFSELTKQDLINMSSNHSFTV